MAKHKLRVKRDDNGASVKMIFSHPMETGSRKSVATGERIPQHFIQTLRCEQNGELAFSANWGSGMAKNPIWHFGCARPNRVIASW